MTKRGFTHDPFGHHTSGNADFLPFQFVIVILDIRAVMRHIIFSDDKRIPAGFLQLCQLVAANLKQFVYISGFCSCHGWFSFISVSFFLTSF